MTWSQEVEQWLPGSDEERIDYDIPGGQTEFIWEPLLQDYTHYGQA